MSLMIMIGISACAVAVLAYVGMRVMYIGIWIKTLVSITLTITYTRIATYNLTCITMIFAVASIFLIA